MKSTKLSALAMTLFLSVSMLTACSSGNQTSHSGGAAPLNPLDPTAVSNPPPTQTSLPTPSAGLPDGSDTTGLPSAVNGLEWSTYSDQYVSLQAPKGWNVTVRDLYQNGDTGSGTIVSVKDPSGDYMVDYIDFYTVAAFTMKSPTVESFFVDAVAGADSTITSCTVTSAIQTDEQKRFAAEHPDTYLDAKLLTMDVVQNGKTYEGYYTATLLNNGSQLTGLYGVVSAKDMIAPKGQLTAYQDVLSQILSSIQINQTRYGNGNTITATIN